ncbi:hypothetical protein [Rhodococcus sp. HNM0569]|uniref:hypothetical protein n=1 Tax=Rhodococcus sp. HNM0569 TaxID=2716340 RepID=UPI00146F20A9|nr:hypothetical protein [Rhodococcus sp. HNM0569]NLU82096.1 hypothetical protein [Rhodococcus sp. HNM0569]
MTDEASGVDVLMSLAGEAKAGELVLDPDVAHDCAKAARDAIKSLQAVQSRMSQQTVRLPLGDFDCGHQLAGMLQETTQQFIDRLDEHITCLRAIHDMVGAQVTATVTTDDETSQAVARMNSRIEA